MVFAIVIVVAAYPRVDRKRLLAPLPWGLMCVPKAVGAYGCCEDALLFLAGVCELIFLIAKWRAIGGATHSASQQATGTP